MPETQTAVAPEPKTRVASVRRSKAAISAKPSDFKLTGYTSVRFEHTMPVGWEFKECLKPEYWVNVCHLLKSDPRTNAPDKAGSIIEIRTQDHEFYAELYIRAVQEQGLVVSAITGPIRLAPDSKKNGADSGYLMRWNVGKGGYDVVREMDGALIGDGRKLRTKEQAVAFIENMKAA